MLFWIIQMTILSIILIFLVHYLINFFKSTLTVPKIKDLVNTPTQNYENIYNIIKQSSDSCQKTNVKPNEDYTLIDLLPKTDETNMKNELKSFLKSQFNSPVKENEILSFEENSGSNSFSFYEK